MDESLNQESAATTFLDFKPRQMLAQAWRWVGVRWAEVICAALLMAMSIQLFAVVARKNITNDEVVHIPAGYYHLVAGEFQLNNEHPPLVKMWAALPLLFIQPKEIPKTGAESRYNFMELTWRFHQYFWSDNKDQFETISFWSRAMMIVLTVLLGVLIFSFARDLFGKGVAVLAVALYVLEPTVLAHGRIVHTDLPAALAYLLFFFVLRKYLQKRSLKRAIVFGLAGGVALTTKFSLIVLLPVLACLMLGGIVFAPRLGEERKKILLHTLVVVLVLWVFVNAAYRFKSPPLEPGDVNWVQIRSPETHDSWMTFFRIGSKVVPTYYLFGQYNVMLHNSDGHPASLLGNYRIMGWWYYFPVAFALKTSLPFLILTVAGLVWAFFELLKKRDQRFLWLLVPVAIYAALSMSSHINIGIRHFLPVYPFFFIAAAVVLEKLLHTKYPRHLSIAAVVLVFAWMAVEEAAAFPNHIPYMNQLAIGEPKWWYLSDSNVEWGDDARDLAAYLHARGETDVRGAFSGAWATLGLYGINYHEMFPRPGVTLPETRYVAIGASFLNGSTIPVRPDESGKLLTDEARVNFLASYRTLQPEVIIGNSIYVYRVK